jgi:ABC-type branched-subunit amino acid transport system ATPase component/ABC-type branched-subunit amino acid transport system permease subunit
MFALTFSGDIIFSGFIQGLVYALVAFGLLLIFRATGVINFAQGQIGAFGGYAMALLYIQYGIPYGLSVPLALAAGALLGVATELILRRLFTQPRLLLFVATLGVTQLIQLLQLRLPIPEDQAATARYPVVLNGRWDVFGITVTGPQVTVMIAVPILVLGLTWLLQRSRFGRQVRAVADNASSAQLAGISIRSVSTKVWGLAGLLAAVSALLIAPIQGGSIAVVNSALGPKLLLLSLAAAMFGRMRSFVWTAVGGIVVGIVDMLFVTWAQAGEVPQGSNILAIFVLLLVLMLTLGRSAGMSGDEWTFTTKLKSASEEIRRHPLYRASTLVGLGLLVGGALLLPSFLHKPTDFLSYATIPVMLIAALSVTVLTGWAGQLSLGQFGFVAIGAYFTIKFSDGLPIPVALLFGVAFGVLAALIIGVPALRIKGLFLAVITLGFGLMVRNWLIFNSGLSGPGGEARLAVTRAKGFDLLFWTVKGTNFRGVYWFCLCVAGLALLLVWQLRRTGVGRSIIAVRDNELSAAAYTVSATKQKILAFAISGGLAALAGGLLPLTALNGQFGVNPGTQIFDVEQSLRIVAVAVVGGIASITGAVLGTLVIVALPLFFNGTPQVKLFTSGIGMLIVLLYFPGGLISVLHSGRDLLTAWLARRTGWEPKRNARSETIGALATAHDHSDDTRTPLVTSRVTVRFGGRVAVDDVSITVKPGEIVGLIGTNGAGKSTLMSAISGFVPSSGDISLFGTEVGNRSAARRSRLGIGRAFQNARLFSSLSVRETLMVALEARERSWLVPSMLSLPPSPMSERRKRKHANEIIGHLGLSRYADSLLGELSTGTRRIVELGALLALDAELLLLDEPTAGVAQRETEAFGPLIRSIREELGASILIIEHDMPMVMSISDRIYCLEAGTVIAEGTPQEVRNDPLVIASYLGTDERAIARSDSSSNS